MSFIRKDPAFAIPPQYNRQVIAVIELKRSKNSVAIYAFVNQPYFCTDLFFEIPFDAFVVTKPS